MERYSLIVVTEETAPIRRFDVLKSAVHRALWGVGALLMLLTLGLVDYVNLRVERPDVQALKAEAEEQRARIAAFEATLKEVDESLERVREFERKVRIIANLPGSAGTGGDELMEVRPEAEGDFAPGAGGEADVEDVAEAFEAEVPAGAARLAPPPEPPRTPAQRVSALREEAERLGLVAGVHELSLKELVDRLEDKHRHLASSPAIWPAKGWLTSRYGYRISPFTGRRQLHAGIDIAGGPGADIIATAGGQVTFVGRKGPLGSAVIVDHGYGVRTVYGHVRDTFVKQGQKVERGQVIASLGNTGRSTGPHLHYAVEVAGKPKNPLDYIFD